MGSIPFAPSSLYSSSPAAQNANRSIRDLLFMGGEERARQAERSGQIWANAIGGVGQAVAGGFQAYAQNKQEKEEQFKASEQEHTAGSFVSDWLDQGNADPMALVQGLTRIKGPKEGPKMAETIIKFAGNSQENDPEKHLKTTASGIDLFLKQSPENQARLWPGFKGGLMPTIEKLRMPVQLSDELTPDTIVQLGLAKDAMLGVFDKKPEKLGTHVVGGALVDDTGKVIYQGEAKPEKPKPTLAEIEAESAARARGTLSVKPPPSATDRAPQKVDQYNPETGEMETTFVSPADALAMSRGEKPGMSKGPGAATKNRMDAARTSIEAGEALISELKSPEFASEIGPLIGRYNSLTAAAGSGDPKAQYLVGAIRSFAALQPQIHGFRAVRFAEDIEKLLSTKQTPEALEAGLKGILTASYLVAKKKAPTERTVVDRGILNGLKVVQYSDGSVEYE